ncbi:MAG TPA: hypothetical protein VLA68_01140 [Nitrososphaera sp.]|nr:hypothetical protein [Nitrososphaera sp.]
MSDFTVKGIVKGSAGNPVSDVKVFALDSDQGLFEDHNDDLLGAAWTKPDGTFEISVSSDHFRERLVEGNPDIYFVVRNSEGEIISRTEPQGGFDPKQKHEPFEILVESAEKKPGSPEDPYSRVMDRTLSAFASLGEVATINNSDFARVFSLLNRSLNAWVVYTREKAWREIGYDGPQVPLRPRDTEHKHKLEWET